MSERYSAAFAAIADLAIALDAAPLTKHENCWVHRLDEKWTIAVNGHKEERPVGVMSLASSATLVPPFSCYVEYNGWPAGIIDPFGGVLAAGDAANEDKFIKAVKAAMPAKETKSEKR